MEYFFYIFYILSYNLFLNKSKIFNQTLLNFSKPLERGFRFLQRFKYSYLLVNINTNVISII